MVFGRDQLTQDAVLQGAERQAQPAPPGAGKKSKVILSLLEAFGLPGALGIDRMYMGQIGLGFLKMTSWCWGCVAVGLVWWVIDYIVVFVNCLRKQKNIDAMGYKADFDESGVEIAFWVMA